ncbi:MAG: LPS export ABC transporter permease LptF [Methyloversatilis sp.]|uniref:Lipopolysaccharide export system permease protein LptF n=1 Tax=Methyloversatilis universalis (strain ATCC BAA-1314 / DSM 25237 / JCM 13912 / CCUG 52030 / FAM5) TaxID=1000565 RepID=F5RDV4_METUF|nr:LPS export ABC transporter permease LptF [Methyloversatilis universalis]EGK71085.1 Putative permease [Methyloversatilis universalis FAM5]MCP4638614.1 LPS export ABC transporter permease LptF [Methyloversatilis sp.]
MIFQRAALREFASTALTVFVALFAIVLSTQLVRLLGQAAGGKVASEAVMALLGFGALRYLGVILSLTLFISVLLAMSRTWRDSEMVVWFATGLPLSAWVRPVVLFALPMVVAVAVLSLYLSPWSQVKSAEFRTRMSNRDDVAQMSPGSFRESSQANRVFFVESGDGSDGAVKNIFVSSSDKGRVGVTVAADGYTQTLASGDRFVVLLHGRRYEGLPGTPEFRVMEFERYAVRIETKESQGAEERPNVLTVQELLADPSPPNMGELAFRIGLPIAALNLALLAIPLSFVNPRAGRANNLLMALLIYLVYSNLLSVTQAMVAQGKLSFGMVMWTLHGGMFLLLSAMFAWRMYGHLPRALRSR